MLDPSTDLFGNPGGGGPAYVAARARARRAKLFDESDYRKLIRMGPNEIARYLEETEYSREVSEMGARFSGVDLVEYALNANLSRHFRELLQWSGGSLYQGLVRYLGRFDAWNIKTVLRGVYSDTPPESIDEDLIRVGALDDALLDSIMQLSSVREVVEELEGTPYYDELDEAMVDFEETQLLLSLENAVDRTFYSRLVKGGGAALRGDDLFVEGHAFGASSGGIYQQFLIVEVDMINVRTAFRIIRSDPEIDPEPFFLEGGRLFDAADMKRLVNDPDLLVETIRDSRYGDELEHALEAFSDGKSMNEIEREMERVLVTFSDRLWYHNPLSIGPVIGYILSKELELWNIRAIARGKEAGLDEEMIREELIIV